MIAVRCSVNGPIAAFAAAQPTCVTAPKPPRPMTTKPPSLLSFYTAVNIWVGLLSESAIDRRYQRPSVHVTHAYRKLTNVALHFTPTYSSWLNQVESWFSKLQRDVIDRGIFTSVADLKRKILRYIKLYQKAAKPFRWKYSDPSRRIPAW